MYAVKSVNLINNNAVHYTAAYHNSYTSACDTMRQIVRDMDAVGWVEDEDYTVEVVEVEDDFDFENQGDWN